MFPHSVLFHTQPNQAYIFQHTHLFLTIKCVDGTCKRVDKLTGLQVSLPNSFKLINLPTC